MQVNFSSKKQTIKSNDDGNATHQPAQNNCNDVENSTNPITANVAEALKAQKLTGSNIAFKAKPSTFTEKDVNIQVTLGGCANIKSNTRSINDFRCSMEEKYGRDWTSKFYQPMLLRNGNGDERYNGPTTAIVIPLNSYTPDLRGGDLVAIVLNGNIPTETASQLINYMAEIGILDSENNYRIKSTRPHEFMSNPKIKTAIAHFMNQKATETISATKETGSVENKTNKYGITPASINIANTDCRQNTSNRRKVQDYIRTFLKNDRKFTVVHGQINESGRNIDTTSILIPSKKDPWDFMTIEIDAKIPTEECKNLVNYLVKQRMTNVDSPDFRQTIIDYFKTVS